MISGLLSDALIAVALLFMALGVLGVFRFRHFYARILITAKVEIIGFLVMMTGIVIRHGFSFFSLKVGLISLFVLLTNPLTTMAITRSAHRSGVRPQPDARKADD